MVRSIENLDIIMGQLMNLSSQSMIATVANTIILKLFDVLLMERGFLNVIPTLTFYT